MEKLNIFKEKTTKNEIPFELFEPKSNLLEFGEEIFYELQKSKQNSIKKLENSLRGINMIFDSNILINLKNFCSIITPKKEKFSSGILSCRKENFVNLEEKKSKKIFSKNLISKVNNSNPVEKIKKEEDDKNNLLNWDFSVLSIQDVNDINEDFTSSVVKMKKYSKKIYKFVYIYNLMIFMI